MAYCTQESMILRYTERELIQLTNDDGIGEIGAEQLAKAIAQADAKINASLSAAGYATPLVWDLLQEHAEAIAYYRLFYALPTEQAQRDFDRADRFLERVREGREKPPGIDPIAAGHGRAAVSSRAAVFSDETWSAYE